MAALLAEWLVRFWLDLAFASSVGSDKADFPVERWVGRESHHGSQDYLLSLVTFRLVLVCS